MSFDALLTTAAQIWRYSVTTDSTGDTVKTWAKSSDITCEIRGLGGVERMLGTREGVESTNRMYCMPTVDITEKDQVRCGNRTYNVTYINNVRGHHMEVDLVYRSTEQ